MADEPSRTLPPVAFAPCADYEPASLDAAIRRIGALLGDAGAPSLRGRRVLVKPNLLADRPPDAAVTTHPAFLRAVLRWLREVGVAGIRVGDSPASAVRLRQVWERTGVEAACRDEGVELLSFEAGEMRLVRRDGIELLVAAAALDADLIVNLPKVKTHGMTLLTCATKNLYGLLPGYQKTQRHREYPSPHAFAGLLRALERSLPPQICLADGIVGMEGDGPSNGVPRFLGFVAASADPIALDLAVCRATGVPARRVPYLADVAHLRPVELGELPPGFPVRLRLPVTWKALAVPRPLARLCARWLWIRPSFNAGDCVRCGRCVAACPKSALAQERGKVPELRDPPACIGCCCCHEVCPANAIAMRKGPLLRIAGVFSELS
ncbi:MAG: DUF362 domain-containing protein [Kiritimatiellia bacterium]|jgi:uncharacterized protein (DUF362 family)/Pyruvate/2-oxoacid:ferredoxin oxidoreductase delta subunit